MYARISVLIYTAAVLAVLGLCTVDTGLASTNTDARWLDKPLAGWNSPGALLPKPPAARESREELIKRCEITPRQSTAAERALAAAGWIPLLHFDRQLVQGDVEIVDGISAADAECMPAGFNTFVFVGGQFAGTLSPALMASRTDGSALAVRILPKDKIRVDFPRYRERDTPCCPSSHMIVTFQIDRQAPSPTVAPLEVRGTPPKF